MRSVARVRNSQNANQVSLTHGDRLSTITIPPKASGYGSSASGGELLMLALATCYCNDIYREAAKMGIEVTDVEVECGAEFPAEGQPAGGITYTAKITAKSPEGEIRELATITDRLAEIHGTVRAAIPVTLTHVDAIPT
jgi:uncharacterized OsmC-like protein